MDMCPSMLFHLAFCSQYRTSTNHLSFSPSPLGRTMENWKVRWRQKWALLRFSFLFLSSGCRVISLVALWLGWILAFLSFHSSHLTKVTFSGSFSMSNNYNLRIEFVFRIVWDVRVTDFKESSDIQVSFVDSGAAKGGRGGRPPPNVFQSVVLDSFKSDELRRRGVGKLSAVSCVSCVNLFI